MTEPQGLSTQRISTRVLTKPLYPKGLKLLPSRKRVLGKVFSRLYPPEKNAKKR